MRIRSMSWGDLDSVSQLCAEFGFPTTIDRLKSRFDLLCSSRTHEAFIAELNEKAIGWIHAYQAPSLISDQTVEIGGLIVHSKHRRTGVGRQLMVTAEKWAIDSGFKEVLLASHIKREDAHLFYESLGYTFVHTTYFFKKCLTM